MKPTLTTEEACTYLNIGAGTLNDFAVTGMIPAAKIGMCWVFRTADLDAYLDEQIRIQTQQRRDGWQTGVVVKVKTAASAVRSGRKAHPKLPELAVV
jgi:excisionase family DNA binding protein